MGALAIAAPRAARLRVYMLTLLVVDDVVALLVVSLVYPGNLDAAAVIVAAGSLTLLLSMRAIAARQSPARGDSTAALTPLSVLTGVALLAPALAVAALAPRRTARVRRGARRVVTSPCPAR
ncbi:Na+/H+ antiporter NhaA [Candidatus Solirubrobacter pratensis]|uniref:Na+/H+ antiporter NhaA n=1 Tax=Candidatus Solirubrobacter pratensis TaxID=1298857 RepID=UPI00041F2FA7